MIASSLMGSGSPAPAEPVEVPTAGPAWLRAPAARGPVAGTLALDGRATLWALDAAVPLGSDRTRSPAPDSIVRRPRMAVGLSVTGAIGSGGGDLRGLGYTALLDRRDSRTGSWFGLSTGAPRGLGEAAARMRLGGGLWRSIAPIEVEGSVVSSVVRLYDPSRWNEIDHFRVAVPESLGGWRDTFAVRGVEHTTVWTTAQSVLRWRLGRIEVETTAGVTLGDAAPFRRWMQGAVHVQLSRRVLLMAAAGRRPAGSLAFDPTAQPRSMIGVQIAPWSTRGWALSGAIHARARAWMTRDLGNGRRGLYLRCADTRRVELAADFTDWLAIPLTPIGGGWWELTRTIEPGLYRVQVRLDGGSWQVPPDLPHAPESFDGPAGMLVID